MYIYIAIIKPNQMDTIYLNNVHVVQYMYIVIITNQADTIDQAKQYTVYIVTKELNGSYSRPILYHGKYKKCE